MYIPPKNSCHPALLASIHHFDPQSLQFLHLAVPLTSLPHCLAAALLPSSSVRPPTPAHHEAKVFKSLLVLEHLANIRKHMLPQFHPVL